MSTENILEGRKSRLRKLILASAAALVFSTAIAVPSWGAVKGNRNLEVDYSRDFVLLESYPLGAQVKVDVLRNGVQVGSFTGKTERDPRGRVGSMMEINHIGGGQFPSGDCWVRPITPDILPGDKVRTKVLKLANGRKPKNDVDYTYVRDLRFEEVNGNLVGHARGEENPDGTFDLNVPVDVSGGALIEARRVQDDRERFFADIVPNANNGGAFNTPLGGAGGEVTLQFINPQGADPEAGAVESTVAGPTGELPEATIGCPPLVENATTTSSSKVINKANIGKGLRLAGIANGAANVRVKLDDRNAGTPSVTLNATLRDTQVAGSQVWRAGATAAQLKRLKDGRLTAVAVVDGAEVGPKLGIHKDTVAPGKPAAAPKPGVYPRTQLVRLEAQAGTQIRYTLDGKRPTTTSRLHKKRIRISKTRTIKAIAIDRAGNKSAIGSFRYVIRR